MGRVGEVAGISDGDMKAIGETRDAVATIAAALDDLVGGQAATDPAGDTPPPEPVDGDGDGNGNPDSDNETDDADADPENENAAETDDDADADPENENAADGYNADVTGDSTGGANAPADNDTDDTDDDDTETEARDGETDDDEQKEDDDEDAEQKGDEINGGAANPGAGYDPGPNPEMGDDERAAAKSLAELFGEPDATYNRATLDMLRDLVADHAN